MRLPLHTLFVLTILATVASSFGQPSVTDSAGCPPAQRPSDSLFLIPCGPGVGTFSAQARVTVEDTVAGWARIRVEGWVPLAIALSRMTTTDSLSSSPSPTPKPELARVRCAAITKKGTPCSRLAKPGSKYCWQHRPK